ncbi:MAG: single-stranded-DNA-specific exonuclease RecJ [Anaerolineae bacterium]|jgi:single-stranded-DNA-specific exonuclease|nr:single-stranded-DNA-specific exonuclease RecJ [Anaerolineae bacterium]MBT7191464.1 single-stranded-DNA-specific exonuclease RecJ [Anaerolineae bacterium]MBT7989476.1 single-stranded-DNA-specific exonuclease RecJ [Anaerolineae bacterium]
MQTHWQIQAPLTADADEALVKFPPVLRQLLFNRGYATDAAARAFLKAAPAHDMSPWKLKDMEIAISRILQAIESKEKIVIYGDYDVDGVTSSALLVQLLRAYDVDVDVYIPNRFSEGYGLNKDALAQLAKDDVNLVITVDCGIRSLDEVEHARGLGLDLIVTDHHHPGEILPNALAVVNPKQDGDIYPEKMLAGVGIAYKIAEAVLEKKPTNNLTPEHLLDLVALGTVADLAPLEGENHALVRKGLRAMKNAQRQGLVSLAAVSGVNIKEVNAMNIGFSLGPRLNAAGRLDSALRAYELLVENDFMRTGEMAQALEMQNQERQKITREMQEVSETIALATDKDALLLFAASPDFNPGVVGLAASRLADRHYRPAIVGHVDEETTVCSCRSISEFHITDALDQCADLLVRHGGHAAAAGFTIRNENVGEFLRRMKEIAAEKLAGVDLRPVLVADMELALESLSFEMLEHLNYLEPTGYGNPRPVFVSRNLRVKSSRTVGKDQTHLKLTVTDGNATLDAIAFRLGHLKADLPPKIDLLYTFEVNEWNGRKSLQLNVKDIKF